MDEKIEIKTEYIKLDSLLKLAGTVSSGGEAKELINGGLVSVNGCVCEMRGKKIRPGDIISVSGKKISVFSGNKI